MSRTASVTENLTDYESDDLRLDLRWWDALNYLTVGQIYLQGNALLREPLAMEHIKPRLLGHWGTSPGLSMIYVLLNRLINRHRVGLDLRHRPGARRPGAGRRRIPRRHLLRGLPAHHLRRRRRPATVPAVLLPRRDPQPRQRADPRQHPRGRRARVRAGARRRGGLRPPRPLRRLRGRRRRGRDRTAVRLVEAARLPQPAPRRRGAADPAPQRLQDRRADRARPHVRRGRGRLPRAARAGTRSSSRATTRSRCSATSGRRWSAATSRSWRCASRPAAVTPSEQIRHRWPAIMLRTPKGWTGPHVVDGVQVEDTNRSHQVPLSGIKGNPAHLRSCSRSGCENYRPDQLFDESGRLVEELRGAGSAGRQADVGHPVRQRRSAAQGAADQGPADLRAGRPTRGVTQPREHPPAGRAACGTCMRATSPSDGGGTFRLFCPDETASNRLQAVFEVTDRCFQAPLLPDRREALGRTAGSWRCSREHLCQGWLEGYLPQRPARGVRHLRGVRHGVGVDGGPARQVAAARRRTCRGAEPVSSLNVLLTSTCWRNDHNGFSHQGPGLIDSLLPLAPGVVRVWLPPDANTAPVDHRPLPAQPRPRQPHRRRQAAAPAVPHAGGGRRALRARAPASGTGPARAARGEEPDIVLAAAGDVPDPGGAGRGRAAARVRPGAARCGSSTSST